MILEVAHLQVIPGQAAAFEQAFGQAQTIISAMPGYAGHQLQHSLTDPPPLSAAGQLAAARRSYPGLSRLGPVPAVEGAAASLLRPFPHGGTLSGGGTVPGDRTKTGRRALIANRQAQRVTIHPPQDLALT